MRLAMTTAGITVVIFGAILPQLAAAQDTLSDSQFLGPGCHFGEIIDSSTADDARTKIEAAGFTNVSGLKKSCDNFWHGHAYQAGKPVNVVLSPAGRVLLEGD